MAGPIQPQTINVSSGGAPFDFAISTSTIPPGGIWLSVTAASGNTSTRGTFGVSVAQGLLPGVYKGQLTLTSGQTLSSPITVDVTLEVMPPVTPGTIIVTSSPLGGAFQLNGPGLTYYTGVTPFTQPNAPTGEYKITWNILLGDYNTPPSETKTLAANGNVSFAGNYFARPVVIVVPGFGASTLTDSNGTDQWLSCTTMLSLNNGFVAPLQYTSNGTSLLNLTPTEILTQSDSVSDTVKLSNQSIVQCSTPDLIADVACTASWLNCRKSQVIGVTRSDIQLGLTDGAHGELLQFNYLLAALTTNGFSPDAWKYDFRKDISALADDLYAEVQRISLTNPGRPIAIVTHSQGALVTAALIAQHPEIYNANLLSNIISMGSPFSGAIDTYLYAQGWRSFLPALSASNTKLMGQNWTSVYQLLPQWDFVTRLNSPFPTKYDIFNGQSDPKHFPALPRASIVPDLASPTSLWSQINRLGPIPRWYAIIGQGHATANQIVEKLNAGKPCLMIEEEDGDGTVPLRSSQSGLIVTQSNRIYVQDEHTHLPQNPNVIRGILKILSGSSAFTVTGLSAFPSAFKHVDTIIVNTCSPVDLTVTDSSGNIVNSLVSQIPDGTFANVGDATQVDVPWNGTFKVQVVGTGAGTFDLLVNGLGGQHSPLSYSFIAVPVQTGSHGTVVVGGNGIPSLQYSFTGKNVIDIIPANTIPPTVICTGCYFSVQNLRATLAFNIGYQGGASTFTYNFRNSAQTIQFASTLTSKVSVTGTTATFSGQGTLNGQAGYNFTVTARDGGSAGSGLDSVAVTITGPNNYLYSVASTIVGGDIVVHP